MHARTATHYTALQRTATCMCNILHYTFQKHCNTLQRTATHCDALQRTATHCNALQRTATPCYAPQRTATHCNALQRTATHCNTLQRTATHCNALQRTATYCNALQHATTFMYRTLLPYIYFLGAFTIDSRYEFVMAHMNESWHI